MFVTGVVPTVTFSAELLAAVATVLLLVLATVVPVPDEVVAVTPL